MAKHDVLVYLTSIILKEAGESNLKRFAFIDLAKIDGKVLAPRAKGLWFDPR